VVAGPPAEQGGDSRYDGLMSRLARKQGCGSTYGFPKEPPMIGIGKLNDLPVPRRLPGALIAAIGAVACVVTAAVPAGASVTLAGKGYAAGAQAGYQFPVPAVGLVKSASIQDYTAAGTLITYTYTVTNTGDAPLADATVTDPMTGLSPINCGGGGNVIPSLAVGASQACTATYTTTANDVANGSVSNTGTVKASGAAGPVSYSASLTIPAKGYAFTCKYPPLYFLSESQTAGGPTKFFDTAPSGFPTYTQHGTYPHAYNAIGFDASSGPNDGYIFGMTRHAGNNELVKIGAPGNVLGAPTAITGYPTAGPAPAVGAFDPSGNYWVTNGGGSTLAYAINVGTPTVEPGSPVLLTKPFKPYDWTWTAGNGLPNGNSSYPGFLWGLSGNQLYRVNTVSGVVGHWTVPGLPTTPSVYGAAWTFANGALGFSNNATGLIYEITVGTPAAAAAATPARSLAGTPWNGPQSSNVLNDGTSCVGQQPTDLGVTSSGPATVAAGGTITWNVTVTNDGPGESSGFLVNDAIKGSISGVTTPTPGCAVTGKGLEVQCAESTLDNGDPFTVTLSGTAPQAAGTCVVSKATVIANEDDPNPKNNTSSAETCTTTATG
jgi:uncharacterized repeat protein (TIGR01451 family)